MSMLIIGLWKIVFSKKNRPGGAVSKAVFFID
jgi:hypothetical protein